MSQTVPIWGTFCNQPIERPFDKSEALRRALLWTSEAEVGVGQGGPPQQDPRRNGPPVPSVAPALRWSGRGDAHGSAFADRHVMGSPSALGRHMRGGAVSSRGL